MVRDLLGGAGPAGMGGAAGAVPSWRKDAANLTACMAHVHGVGLNIRFLG